MPLPGWCWTASWTTSSGRSASSGLHARRRPSRWIGVSETSTASTIRVNGEPEPFGAATIADLLGQRGIDPGGRGLAIALNGAVVPRAAWAQTELHPDDVVEIVQAKQ